MYNNFLKIKNIYLIIIIFIFYCFLYTSVYGNEFNNSIIYVDIDGEGNFSSIQKAIDHAEFGDIIFVRNGIYYENIVFDKSISLIGENNSNTIIDGRLAGNVIKINSNNVLIQNFTIQNSGTYFPNSGINITSNHNTIEYNVLKNNFYGMTLYNSLNNTIQNNIIKENDHCGIYSSNSSLNMIFNNIIINHNFNGIGLYDKSNNNFIKNNDLMNNGYCGINIKISSMNEIMMNNISNNYIGIKNSSTDNIIVKNNISNNNIDIEEDNLTPGFKFVLFLISILIIFLVINRKNNMMKK